MIEIKTEKYAVKIHPGKMTDEERKEAIINAAKKFYQGIQPCLVGNDNSCTGNQSPCVQPCSA